MWLRGGVFPVRSRSLLFDLNLISRSRASADGLPSRDDSPSFASLGVKWVSNPQIKCSTTSLERLCGAQLLESASVAGEQMSRGPETYKPLPRSPAMHSAPRNG
jgi:hypothetical protein